MPLKAVVESLDDVAEGVREHYTEATDGKFYLDAEDVDNLPSVRGLKTKRDELLAAQAKAKDELKKYDGIDPEEFQRLKAAAEDSEKEKLEKGGKWDEMKQSLETQHQKNLKKKDDEREALVVEIARRDRFIEELLIDNQIDGAMGHKDVAVLELYRPAVKALLLATEKPRVVQDGAGYRSYFETDMGEVDIMTFIRTWARSDAAAPFLPAEGTSGSGAASGGARTAADTINPWKKESFNLTQQGAISLENPTRAAQLKAAAGAK